jgi:hypothetical protein
MKEVSESSSYDASEAVRITVEQIQEVNYANTAVLEDLPIPEATEEELAKLPLLRDEVLKLLGKNEVPQGPDGYLFRKAVLLQFLRDRDGDVEAASNIILEAMEWFSTSRYWSSIQQWTKEPEKTQEILTKRFPFGNYGFDKRGMPILIERIGKVDIEGLIRECGKGALLRFRCAKFELHRKAHMEACKRKGEVHLGLHMVLDQDGISWASGQQIIPILLWLNNDIIKDHFPGALKMIHVVNPSWYQTAGWAIIKNILPEATVNKVKFYSDSDSFLEEVQEYIDPDQLPAFLGGTNPTPWPYGDGEGLPNRDQEKDQCRGQDEHWQCPIPEEANRVN